MGSSPEGEVGVVCSGRGKGSVLREGVGQALYEKGWDKGRDKGWDKGYDKGFDEGEGIGLENGWNKGWDRGSTKGKEEGLQKGWDKKGYKKGGKEEWPYPAVSITIYSWGKRGGQGEGKGKDNAEDHEPERRQWIL